MQAPRTRGALAPAAQLLRSSRVFSLPAALPRPQPQLNTFESDTATLPYPTQQAIATLPSSLARGDWGLKRPLPLKTTTRTSSPVFRVSSIDTIEHITDFESAADHTRTLQKWQEMNLSIADEIGASSTAARRANGQKLSAFESRVDNTATASSSKDSSEKELFSFLQRPEKRRWKFRGPAVDRMSETDFTRYLANILRRDREHFRTYLRQRIREKQISDRRLLSREKGVDFDEVAAEPTEEDYGARIKLLRDDFATRSDGSELERIIRDFLDLSPTPQASSSARDSDLRTTGDFVDVDDNVSARTTHPSAGLSYLRSHAYLENHPVLGPQSKRSPVEARVLRPRVMTGKTTPRATLGVGGIVTTETNTSHFRTAKKGVEDPTGISYFVPKEEGGSKVWVVPEHGVISRDGRIKLFVNHANPKSIEIKQGRLPQPDLPSRGQMTTLGQRFRQDEFLDRRTKTSSSSAGDGPRGYGLEETGSDFLNRLRESSLQKKT
jgi:hypothetical protein